MRQKYLFQTRKNGMREDMKRIADTVKIGGIDKKEDIGII